ncbi:MAG: hypothetical protein ACXWDL_12665 [Nocardioides sp.]
MSREPEDEPRDIRASHHDPSGDMGVSSEREGPTGPGQTGTDGVRDVTAERPDDEDAPPEQRPGNEEENPEGLPPKAGYSQADPRSDG